MHVNLLKRHHDCEFSACFTNLTNVNFSEYENRRSDGKTWLLPNSEEQKAENRPKIDMMENKLYLGLLQLKEDHLKLFDGGQT